MFQPGQKGACGRKCSLNIREHLLTSLHIIEEQLRIKLKCDLLVRKQGSARLGGPTCRSPWKGEACLRRQRPREVSNYHQCTGTLEEYQVGTFVDLVTEKRPLVQTRLAQVTSCWGWFPISTGSTGGCRSFILKQLFFFLLNLNNVNAKESNGALVSLSWQTSLEAFRRRAWVWH